MIAAWMLYAVLVAGLVGGAALALETVFRSHRKPARWIWASAGALSTLWSVRLLMPEAWRYPWGMAEAQELASTPPPSGWGLALDPLTLPIGSDSLLQRLDAPLLVLWGLASVVLLISGGLLLRRTQRLRTVWEGGESAGRTFLLSEDCGPAVVGIIKPTIVLPQWCRALEKTALSLILDHEEEHRRAGDLRLLTTMALLSILFPWNIPLWWHFRRLRVAVEADCDLRVLRNHPGRAREYLGLLLEVGRRPSLRRTAAAMLSEADGTLERRIRIMTTPKPSHPLRQGLLLGAAAAFLLALACEAPEPRDSPLDPTEPSVELPPPAGDLGASAPGEVRLLENAPTFTPYTVRPDVTNREEMVAALEGEYPPLLRDAGIGGQVVVWFFIDETGTVQKLQVAESSGHKALDEAALRVGAVVGFTPAMNEDEAVPVWISLPITFSVPEGSRGAEPVRNPAVDPSVDEARARDARLEVNLDDVGRKAADASTSTRTRVGEGEEAELIPPPPPDPYARPTFTPYTVKPDVKNREEIQRALEREYPTLLRDAGIGGQVLVWFFIDETGKVRRALLNQTSGHEPLDEAALRVAEVIEFTPALNRDQRVPVWISLPITFTTR
jgi:TonB family protein